MKLTPFETQIDADVLSDLKSFAENVDRSIPAIVSEAVAEYLKRAHLRPEFAQAMERVLLEDAELLRRLAK